MLNEFEMDFLVNFFLVLTAIGIVFFFLMDFWNRKQ